MIIAVDKRDVKTFSETKKLNVLLSKHAKKIIFSLLEFGFKYITRSQIIRMKCSPPVKLPAKWLLIFFEAKMYGIYLS